MLKKIDGFITRRYHTVITFLFTAMLICLFNIVFGLMEVYAECRASIYLEQEYKEEIAEIKSELKKELQDTVTKMQLQTEVVLWEHGCEWDGTEVVESNKR